MATYYVGLGGSDGAAGTTYGARWLTIAKALGAAGIASGDTVYLSPGTYREIVTVAMTSATVTTNVVGDVDGSHTSGVPGFVQWTAYTTNDTTVPSGSSCLDLNGRDFLAFSNICWVGGGGNPGCVTGVTVNPTDITFTDCFMTNGVTGGNPVSITSAAGVASNWTFNRCTIQGLGGNSGSGAILILFTRHTVDYDANIVFTNCIIQSNTACISIASAGAGAGFGGGVKAKNCTLIGVHGVRALDANLSLGGTVAIGADIKNSFLYCQAGVRCSTATVVISEDHNVFASGTPRTNVNVGTGSQTNYAPLFYYGQERLISGQNRPAWSPTSDSPLLAFGGATPSTVDLLNRPRPSGGSSISAAAGALERHDFGTKDTVVSDAGGVAIRLTGPGDHQFQIPVNAALTTITIKVLYDSVHATTNPPQAQLLTNNEIGYTTETITAASTLSTWLTLSFTPFTPSAKGIVTLRLISRAAADAGYAVFDTVSIT